MIPPSPASDSPPTCAETLNPQSTSEEKLETVADAPAVNVWEMRKKQNEAKSQKPEKPAAEASVPSMFQVSALYVVCFVLMALNCKVMQCDIYKYVCGALPLL